MSTLVSHLKFEAVINGEVWCTGVRLARPILRSKITFGHYPNDTRTKESSMFNTYKWKLVGSH